MLTKTLKFDSDVLAVLRAMEWSEDGRLGKITSQLDRKLYEKVNKALDAMGGKWNRGKGSHVFSSDPRVQVEGLLSTGALSVERDGFFETPPAVVDKLLGAVFIRGALLEPSAGRGAIADRILPHQADRIVCIEKNSQRVDVLAQKGYTVMRADFLNVTPDSLIGHGLAPESLFDTILMNPPFEEGQDMAHVRHAYEFLAPGGQLGAIVSSGVFFRSDRKSISFREWFSSVYGHAEELPVGSFKANGTGVSAYMLVIHKQG